MKAHETGGGGAVGSTPLPRWASLLPVPRNPPAPLSGKQTCLSGYTLEQPSWKVAFVPPGVDMGSSPPTFSPGFIAKEQNCPPSFSVEGPNPNLTQKRDLPSFTEGIHPPALELCCVWVPPWGRPELSCVGGGLGDFSVMSHVFLFPFREWNLSLS